MHNPLHTIPSITCEQIIQIGYNHQLNCEQVREKVFISGAPRALELQVVETSWRNCTAMENQANLLLDSNECSIHQTAANPVETELQSTIYVLGFNAEKLVGRIASPHFVKKHCSDLDTFHRQKSMADMISH